MSDINHFAKWFERLKNYISSGLAQETTSLYVLVLLVSFCPIVLCFIYVVAEFLRYGTSD